MTTFKQLYSVLQTMFYNAMTSFLWWFSKHYIAPMNSDERNFIKVVIITKEKGTLTFKSIKKWHGWKTKNERLVTLHSTEEPAFQWYYKNECKFAWFYNNLKHRPDAPAVYSFKFNDKTNVRYSHNFKFVNGELFNYKENMDDDKKLVVDNLGFYLNGIEYDGVPVKFKSPENTIEKFLSESKKYSRKDKILDLLKDE